MRAVMGLVAVLSACTSVSPDAQQKSGEAAYTQYCAACHKGESVGPRLTPEVLATRGTAARLYTYNQTQMPYNNGHALSDEQYLDITAWMLHRSGLLPQGILLRMQGLDTLVLNVD